MAGIDALKTYLPFSIFSRNQLMKLDEITVQKSFQPKDVIYRGGDPADHLHAAVSGSVSLSGFFNPGFSR